MNIVLIVGVDFRTIYGHVDREGRWKKGRKESGPSCFMAPQIYIDNSIGRLTSQNVRETEWVGAR